MIRCILQRIIFNCGCDNPLSQPLFAACFLLCKGDVATESNIVSKRTVGDACPYKQRTEES